MAVVTQDVTRRSTKSAPCGWEVVKATKKLPSSRTMGSGICSDSFIRRTIMAFYFWTKRVRQNSSAVGHARPALHE